jgi:hypothetical protein
MVSRRFALMLSQNFALMLRPRFAPMVGGSLPHMASSADRTLWGRATGSYQVRPREQERGGDTCSSGQNASRTRCQPSLARLAFIH